MEIGGSGWEDEFTKIFKGSSWIFHSQREKYAFCILRSIFMMSSDLAEIFMRIKKNPTVC